VNQSRVELFVKWQTPDDAFIRPRPVRAGACLVRLYACMCVCMHLCTYACMYVCMYVHIHVCLYVSIHVRVYHVCTIHDHDRCGAGSRRWCMVQSYIFLSRTCVCFELGVRVCGHMNVPLPLHPPSPLSLLPITSSPPLVGGSQRILQPDIECVWCCSVLQCVAVCCSVLQFFNPTSAAGSCSSLQYIIKEGTGTQRV